MKPKISVHKFSSCDGCQLAFLNAGEALLDLAERADITHFIEAGPYNPDEPVDIAFVEGSISTAKEEARIQSIRAGSRLLIALGACATAGGIQALRNLDDHEAWKQAVYAEPQYIETLATSRPIAEVVDVDLEIPGCPVNGAQVMAVAAQLLADLPPAWPAEKLCMECKRRGNPCVVVTRGEPCLGPITHGGCNALCPAHDRGCYGCFGPAPEADAKIWAARLRDLGLSDAQIANRYLFITSHAEPLRSAGLKRREGSTA